jgi:hypothetical protein
VFQSHDGAPALQLFGPRAALLWGYREVAGLTYWRIVKGPQAWVLTATLGDRAPLWECRQAARYQELLFTAPRAKGRWCFPVVDFTASQTELRATVGPPLQ